MHVRCSRRTVEPVSMSLPGSRGKPSGQLAGLCHVPVLLSPVLHAVPQPCLQSCSANTPSCCSRRFPCCTRGQEKGLCAGGGR